MKTVIFDIDGTLANLDHRLHHIKGEKKDWDAFHDFAKNDLPITQIIQLLRTLHMDEYDIILVTGRTTRIMELTENWLAKHHVPYDALYMREEGDYRPDTVIKKEILARIRKDYPAADIHFVVDDRSSVVKMWREEGLICLQCNEWEENGRKA